MKRYVLDSSAVIHYVQNGPGAPKVTALLTDAIRQQAQIAMSVLHLGEVFYLQWRRTGEEEARRTIARLTRLPIRFLPVDVALALDAARIKSTRKIPYADSIAAAQSLQLRATLVTSDSDFEKLGHNFSIVWLPHFAG